MSCARLYEIGHQNLVSSPPQLEGQTGAVQSHARRSKGRGFEVRENSRRFGSAQLH